MQPVTSDPPPLPPIRKSRNRAKSLRKSALLRQPGKMYLDATGAGTSLKPPPASGSGNVSVDSNDDEDESHLISPVMMRDSAVYRGTSSASGVSPSRATAAVGGGGGVGAGAAGAGGRGRGGSGGRLAVDYADTVWWGWFLLCTTWVVFVVGMGSVLGVWDWAWAAGGDVDEITKQWVDDVEDYGLPMPGYYPSLVILTSVMAWVWVVVAWVGMKYFKHAKIQTVDDS